MSEGEKQVRGSLQHHEQEKESVVCGYGGKKQAQQGHMVLIARIIPIYLHTSHTSHTILVHTNQGLTKVDDGGCVDGERLNQS